MVGKNELVIEKVEDLSGWILPDGKWQACDDWWHIPVLYDLRDANYPCLTSPEARKILHSGVEESIRDFASSLGFFRVSRKMIDGRSMTLNQLATLQSLLEFCNLDSEIGLLGPDPNGPVRTTTVEKILKSRNPQALFPAQKQSSSE